MKRTKDEAIMILKAKLEMIRKLISEIMRVLDE